MTSVQLIISWIAGGSVLSATGALFYGMWLHKERPPEPDWTLEVEPDFPPNSDVPETKDEEEAAPNSSEDRRSDEKSAKVKAEEGNASLPESLKRQIAADRASGRYWKLRLVPKD